MAKQFRYYEVEKILGHRERKGKPKSKAGQLQYLLKWKDYEQRHNSWEPESNVLGCDDLLMEYRSKMAVRTKG
jgi:hypothetical protein